MKDWAKFCACFMLLVLMGSTSSVSAHDLKNNTARVELRDNHFRILIDVKILDWLALLGDQGSKAKPTFDSGDIPARLATAEQALLSTTTLLADGELADIRILHFPKERDILDMLEHFAWVQERGQPLPHGFGWTTLQLEGIIETLAPAHIEASFPASLGEMAVSFNQPQSQWVQPAARASFSAAPSKPSAAESVLDTSALAGKWAGLGALLVAFLILFFGRKKTEPSPTQDKSA